MKLTTTLRTGLLLTGATILSFSACAQDDPTKTPGATAKTQDAAATKTGPKSLVDPKIEPYTRVPGISGNLNSIGSDTLNNLMAFWAESFRKVYPQVRIQVEGKGSSTAPPALIEGTAQFGPMSRRMKPKEIDAFQKKYGYKPTEIGVAIDALAVFVNKDNPIEKLTLQQVDSMFSSTRKFGGDEVKSWGDIGLDGEWANKPLSLYGRNSASGTYGYFKKVALKGGDYNNKVKEQPGSASVVRSITEDMFGVGYSGIGYKTSGVKTVAIAKDAKSGYFGTDAKTVLAGKYPLSRVLYIYINKNPRKDLDPLVAEFIRFVLSKEGQIIVEKDGYLPLPKQLTTKFTKELN